MRQKLSIDEKSLLIRKLMDSIEPKDLARFSHILDNALLGNQDIKSPNSDPARDQ